MIPHWLPEAILAAAAVVILFANPVAKWFRKGDADLDRMVSEALDEPDWDANVAAFDRLGRTR